MTTPKNDVDAWAAALGQGLTVPFTFSRGKTVFMIVVSLIFVLIGLAMAGGDSILWKVIGWLAVVLFAMSVVVQIRRLFRREPAIEVSPEGVTMTTAKAGTIPWSHILDVRGIKQSSNVFIELVVTTEEADRQAASGLTVGERELEDGTSQKVLWAPNGVAVSKPALCAWLHQESMARRVA